MEESSQTPKPKDIIEKPDITNPEIFDRWLDEYVKKPFISFEDKKHEDGTPYSFKEKVEASKEQLKKVGEDFAKMGKSQEFIQNILVSSVKDLQEGK